MDSYMINEFEDVLEQHTSLQHSKDDQALQTFVAERKQHVNTMREVIPGSSWDPSGAETNYSTVREVATGVGAFSEECQARCGKF